MRLHLLMIALLAAGSSAHADTLRAGGVGAATELLPILFSAFVHEQTKLEVIPSLGSNGGLRALSEYALDIAVSGRVLNAEEVKLGLVVAAAIRTPFVVVTSHLAPNGLTKDKVANIFSEHKPTWTDGSPIRVILRPKSDSDTPAWIASFPGMAAALEAARARHDVPTAATDQDSADLAEGIQGSFAGSTLTQVKCEVRNLRLVAIDGVIPSIAAMESGTYPFHKTLYFVLPAEKKPVTERFIGFIRSAAGQALLRKTGNMLIVAPGAG